MGRLLRFLFMLIVIASVCAVAYVAAIDIPAPKGEIVQKVPHDVLFPSQ